MGRRMGSKWHQKRHTGTAGPATMARAWLINAVIVPPRPVTIPTKLGTRNNQASIPRRMESFNGLFFDPQSPSHQNTWRKKKWGGGGRFMPGLDNISIMAKAVLHYLILEGYNRIVGFGVAPHCLLSAHRHSKDASNGHWSGDITDPRYIPREHWTVWDTQLTNGTILLFSWCLRFQGRRLGVSSERVVKFVPIRISYYKCTDSYKYSHKKERRNKA